MTDNLFPADDIAETWQTQARATDDQEYENYLAYADDGQGRDFITGQLLKTYEQWLNS